MMLCLIRHFGKLSINLMHPYFSLEREKSKFTKLIFLIWLNKRLKVSCLCVNEEKWCEFENEPSDFFYEIHGIIHDFSYPITLQQNGVVERKK